MASMDTEGTAGLLHTLVTVTEDSLVKIVPAGAHISVIMHLFLISKKRK